MWGEKKCFLTLYFPDDLLEAIYREYENLSPAQEDIMKSVKLDLSASLSTKNVTLEYLKKLSIGEVINFYSDGYLLIG